MLKIAMKVDWEVTSRCQVSDRKQMRNTLEHRYHSGQNAVHIARKEL